MKTFRNPASVHEPVANYMHQVETDASERGLILSGQIGMRENGDVPENPLEQLEVALENVFRNLEAANMSRQDLLKLTFYHVGRIESAERSRLIAKKLEGHKPCMTVLFVATLASPKIKVEIDAVASCAE